MSETEHADTLIRLRDNVLDEMDEAEKELSRLRMVVERMESDLRIGKPEHPDYTQTKGHALPQAEQRIVDLFRQLLKLEDQIKLSAARSTG